jgi:hypothetical protein
MLVPEMIKKARVRQRIGNVLYRLEDDQGVDLGTYHTKDIRT